MRSNTILWMAVACLAAIGGANEPWREKPYTAWNDADVHKILEDSPWAKTITVPAIWLRKGAQGTEVGIKATFPPAPKNPDAREDPDLSLPPAVHDKLYEQFARFLVRWESSRTVRTALQLNTMRQAASGGTPSDPKLASDLPEYEFLLVGDPLAPFPIATESELLANTALKTVSGGRITTPSRVVLNRRDDGQILDARFFFRKFTGAGQILFRAREKAIEFQCRVGGTFLRVRFEPAKMIDADGPDLR
jgi:hypothetical protein